MSSCAVCHLSSSSAVFLVLMRCFASSVSFVPVLVSGSCGRSAFVSCSVFVHFVLVVGCVASLRDTSLLYSQCSLWVGVVKCCLGGFFGVCVFGDV